MTYDEPALLKQCHPLFAQRLKSILAQLRQMGWQPKIAELIRTPEQQREKVRRGYSKTMSSWHVPGTSAILREEPGTFYIVHGNAADIVDQRYGWSGPAANLDYKFWKDLGRIAKAFDCEWGGDWKSFRDVAHIEWKYIDGPPQHSKFA